jgi:MFS transporter, putative metabolite:H+ symporter
MFAWGGYVAPWLALGCVALFGQDEAWRAMFVFGALPVLMVFIRSRALPESPRWLLNQGRTSEADSIITDFERSARRFKQPLPEPVIVVQPRIQKTRFLELFEKPTAGAPP